VLKRVDLALSAGEFVAIEGRSGSGKSTLMHILGALDAPDEGTVEFEGTEYGRQEGEHRVNRALVTALVVCGVAGLAFGGEVLLHALWREAPTALYIVWCGLCAVVLAGYVGWSSYLRERTSCRLRNKEFGFVFQFYHLLPELTVLENTLLAPRVEHSWMGYFRDRSQTQRRATELLNQLGLEHRLGHRPNQLSGGERQRVAIARALMNRPRILFADEPTGNLDADTGRQIMAVLEKLHREQGQTIVMVTHDRALARTADRVLVLREGRLDRAES
jgi:ABC-type lipoprotein export system ATPase subunit